jgi:hypothetical protein
MILGFRANRLAQINTTNESDTWALIGRSTTSRECLLSVRGRAQVVLMSVWRTCWQQGRSALDFLSHLLRGLPVARALLPDPRREADCADP